MIFFDVLRVVLAIVAFVLAGSMLRGWSELVTARRVRRAGIAVLLFIFAGSRLENIGGPITWQLLAGVLVLACIGYSEVERVRGAPGA